MGGLKALKGTSNSANRAQEGLVTRIRPHDHKLERVIMHPQCKITHTKGMITHTKGMITHSNTCAHM